MVGGPVSAMLGVSDGEQVSALRQVLSLSEDGVRVSLSGRDPRPGEQGALELLTVVASGSGALAAALRALPEFIRSRRSNLSITVSTRGKQVTLNAENLPHAAELLDKLFDE